MSRTRTSISWLQLERSRSTRDTGKEPNQHLATSPRLSLSLLFTGDSRATLPSPRRPASPPGREAELAGHADATLNGGGARENQRLRVGGSLFSYRVLSSRITPFPFLYFLKLLKILLTCEIHIP
jgi:hypothetical protein